jgi:hypothetical protein
MILNYLDFSMKTNSKLRSTSTIIKIETFGFILKIGDVGTFIVKPKKNIILIGHAYNIEINYKVV